MCWKDFQVPYRQTNVFIKDLTLIIWFQPHIPPQAKKTPKQQQKKRQPKVNKVFILEEVTLKHLKKCSLIDFLDGHVRPIIVTVGLCFFSFWCLVYIISMYEKILKQSNAEMFIYFIIVFRNSLKQIKIKKIQKRDSKMSSIFIKQMCRCFSRVAASE